MAVSTPMAAQEQYRSSESLIFFYSSRALGNSQSYFHCCDSHARGSLSGGQSRAWIPLNVLFLFGPFSEFLLQQRGVFHNASLINQVFYVKISLSGCIFFHLVGNIHCHQNNPSSTQIMDKISSNYLNTNKLILKFSFTSLNSERSKLQKGKQSSHLLRNGDN